MSDLPRETRFLPRDSIVFRTTIPGGVLIDLTTGAYFELNGVGAAIWARLAAGDTLGEMTDVIRANYGVSAEVAENDVIRWCREALDAGLVAARLEAR